MKNIIPSIKYKIYSPLEYLEYANYVIRNNLFCDFCEKKLVFTKTLFINNKERTHLWFWFCDETCFNCFLLV